MDEPIRKLERSATDLTNRTNIVQHNKGGNQYGWIKADNIQINDNRGTDSKSSREDPYPTLIDSLPWGCPAGYLESIEREKSPRTCQWIEKEKQFESWIEGERQILWVLGGSGTGKTVLSSHIIDYITKKIEAGKKDPNSKKLPDTYAYCFCDAGDSIRSTAGGVVGAILRQLLMGHREHLKPTNNLFADQLKATSHDSGELSLFLRGIIKELGDHLGNIFLIIDGLDGCDSSSGKVFIRGLEKLVEHTSTKILVTSQPMDWIVEELGNIDNIVETLDVQPPMLKSGDIERMINDKFPKLNLSKFVGEETQSKLENLLIKDSGKNFMWASLVMKNLETSRGQLQGLDFDQICQGFFSCSHDRVQHAYDRILEGICRRHVGHQSALDEVEFVLQLLLATKRPLTAAELDMAYAIHSGGDHAARTIPNPRKIRRGIHESCIPLVSFSPETNVVTLMHKSASEYLLGGEPIRLLAAIRSLRSCCPAFCHAWIVTPCLWIVWAISTFAWVSNSCFSRLSGSSSSASQTTRRRQQNHMAANLVALNVCLRVLCLVEMKLDSKPAQNKIGGAKEHGDSKSPLIQYVATSWQDHALAIDPKHMRKWIEKLRSVRNSERHRDSLLLHAAKHGQTNVLQVLLKYMGASPSVHDDIGRTALHLAAFRGHDSAVQTLIFHGADLNRRDSIGAAAVHWAAGGAKPETFDKLFDLHHRRDVPRTKGRGWRIWKTRSLEPRIKPDPEMPDDGGATLLVWAVEGGSKEIVEFLLKKGAKTDIVYTKYMRRFIFNTDGLRTFNLSPQDLVEEVMEVLSRLFGLKHDQRTPLARAAEFGQDRIVQLLLEFGADPDFQDDTRRTPIFWAAKRGHQTVAGLLTRRGTRCGFQLCLAIALRDSAAVKNLLKLGDADPMFLDSSGLSLLAWAAWLGDKRAMEALLESPKANVDFRNMEERITALWIAAFRGNKDVVELLVDKNASLNMADISGSTPLAVAALAGHDGIMKTLLESGRADLSLRDCKGRTALMAAARTASATTFGLMLQKDKNLNRVDDMGRSAIFHAIGAGNRAAIDLILSEPSLDISITDFHGSTPVSMAAMFGDRLTLQKLFQNFPKETKGQLVSIDKFGRSPLKWAILNGHLSTKKLLLAQYKAIGLPPGNDASIPVINVGRMASKTKGLARLFGECDVCLFGFRPTERRHGCHKCFKGTYHCCDRCWTTLSPRPTCPQSTHRMVSCSSRPDR